MIGVIAVLFFFVQTHWGAQEYVLVSTKYMISNPRLISSSLYICKIASLYAIITFIYLLLKKRTVRRLIPFFAGTLLYRFLYREENRPQVVYTENQEIFSTSWENGLLLDVLTLITVDLFVQKQYVWSFLNILLMSIIYSISHETFAYNATLFFLYGYAALR